MLKIVKQNVIKPSFASQKMFSENFVVIHETEPVFTINNPIYVRFSILDLRKLLIHQFYYNHINRKCSANLLFTDTDITHY